MRRTHVLFGLIWTSVVAAVVIWSTGLGRSQPVRNGQQPVPSAALPLSQVILFNNGIGYFQREGEIDGTARVDLSFPATDVNDLIKSLVLQDAHKGTISAISYDGQEPIERALQSFSLDLALNPTFGQLLNQARGEKVEVTLQAGGATSSVTGTVLGMQSEPGPNQKEEHQLNLLCADGMRHVPLAQVQRVRFLNPALDTELRRALEVLAGSHNSQRRTVSLHVKGEGKRMVKLGYVVENPIWKATYRLLLGTKGQPTLQGWAVVENTSDEDWKDVRMALISGRPFTFQMDLYQPLFVPRPTVEPEMFASLRPPLYQSTERTPPAGMQQGFNQGFQGGFNQGFVQGGQGFQGGFNQGFQGFNQGFQGFNQGFNNGFQGAPAPARVRGLPTAPGPNSYQPGAAPSRTAGTSRLTYEELIQRRKTALEERRKALARIRQLGGSLAEGLSSLPTADESGDTYRYALDQKVSLPRQKSALLPVLHESVQVTRVSIYNQPIHPKFPLLGMKLKNTTKQPLMQGPLAVFDGGAFAGDVRMPDLKPDEERLLSYALDLGLEVQAPRAAGLHTQLLNVLVRNGQMRRAFRQRSTTTYAVRNRSREDRLLIVSHPITSGWTVVGKEKPALRSRDLYRFEWKVPAGTTKRYEVVEDRPWEDWSHVSSLTDETIHSLLDEEVASEPLKDALRKEAEHRQRVAAAGDELREAREKLTAIETEQSRVRENINTVPKGSAPHKRYVATFDQLETALQKARGDVEAKESARKRVEKAHATYLANLSVR
jgi:hypothetical protein